MILVSVLPGDWGDSGKVTQCQAQSSYSRDRPAHTRTPCLGKIPQAEREERMLGYLARPDLASLKDEYRHKRPKRVRSQYIKSGEKWLEAGYNSTS